AGYLARHIDQYHVDDVNSPGSSVSSGSEIAGFYGNHNATQPETESCENRSDVEAGAASPEDETGAASPDDEAGAPPNEPKPTVEVYPGSASTLGDVEDYNKYLDDLWNPWAPFYDTREWQLARWFIQSKTTKTQIDEFFNLGLHSSQPGNRPFQSSFTLRQTLERMTGAPRVWKHGSSQLRSHRND
ncbi:hypothetical protein Q9L58_010832, partial [Maublancomyces gigas]